MASAAVENDTAGVAENKTSTPTPVQEPPVVASQAPEPQLTTPSSKGQRNLQDSTFSISGESPSGLHDQETGRCVFIFPAQSTILHNHLASIKICFPFLPLGKVVFYPCFCFSMHFE